MAKNNQAKKAGKTGTQDGAAAPSAPNTSAPENGSEHQADVSAPEAGQPASGAATDPVTQPENAQGGDKTSPDAGEIKAVALLVTAKRAGFRRCNRAWSKEQTRVPIDVLTADEVEALLAEPMLDVVVEGE